MESGDFPNTRHVTLNKTASCCLLLNWTLSDTHVVRTES